MNPFPILMLAAALAAPLAALAATPVHKCEVNGSVTFQSTPCPTGESRPQPSLERLNAEARRQREAAAARSAASAPVRDTAPVQAGAPKPYRCDGRTRCTQMHSCEEATFFLRNCPGVEMDGDHDGIPCETQWCR